MRYSLAEIARIRGWMAAAGVGGLVLEGPGTRLVLGGETQALVVSAPAVGVFLAAHPAGGGDLAPAGTRVRAGDVMGLLRVGVLLLPVVAPVAGVVGPARVAEGVLVGFGTELFELYPLPEGVDA